MLCPCHNTLKLYTNNRIVVITNASFKVRAFDPFVNESITEEYINNYSQRIVFSKIGLHDFSQQNMSIGGVSNIDVLTLEDAIDR